MKSWKVISVTPAGRRRYLEVLVPYLLANRTHITEHHFWVNTIDEADIRYIHDLTEQYPDYFKMKSREVFDRQIPGHCIWQYWQDCVEEDTIYIRLDDDVCFVRDDAVPNLITFRLNNPDPFLVYGNIVNNALCSYLHQSIGIIPKSWGIVQFQCMDEIGWLSGRFAQRVHNLFLKDIRNDSTQRWLLPVHELSNYERFSINVICWFGKDLKQISELQVQDLRTLQRRHAATGEDLNHEEAFVTQYIPQELGRPCIICGDALFSHFAFYTQRPYLETYTALLDWYRYRALAKGDRRLTTQIGLSVKSLRKMMGLLNKLWFWRALCRKILRKFSM